MTHGIIQEVIKKIILDIPAEWYHRSTFITLEQELIKKIKQYELLCYKDNGQPTTYVPKTRLIGDNQE